MQNPPRKRYPSLAASLSLALLVHGSLLVSGTFRGTYDAYVHIFLGDHYARDWFSTWETRWYTGFTTVSYPPGTHQIIALLSKVIGLEAAFVTLQLIGIALVVVGVHRMANVWVSREAAHWAALFAAISTSIAEAIHVFGQLPTIVSLGLLLNATPYVDRWLRTGSRSALVLTLSTLAATTACHHVTTLFGSVFFLGPIVARVLVDAWRSSHPASQVVTGFARTAVFGALLISALVMVVLPYWLWSSSDPISQVPIPHGSRADFLDDVNAGLVFFVIPWGWLLLVAIRSISAGLRGRAWPLALSVVLLSVLGTGGTTPIPRFLLRGAFDILTLDRFTFWATIAILPFVGETIVGLVRSTDSSRLARFGSGGLAVLGVAAFVFTANLSEFRPLQPDTIDPAPIADFLDKDQHDRWRYLTLGFGDQMAWVSAQTTATTVDGNYHSARRLPELVSRPVERLEGAKFRGMPGLGSLQQFATTPERYNLKFIFSNDTFYDPLLFANGWHRVETLINGVVVWERADVTPLPDTLPISELPLWQRLMWGLLPLSTVALAATTNGAALRGWETKTSATAIIANCDARTLWRRRFVSPRWLRVAAATVVVGAFVAPLWQASSATPSDQVYDYYDDLDFGRLEQAWERLDPATRPSFDQYSLERSVRDGLVDGYAKLDELEIVDSSIVGDIAEIEVRAHYITSLDSWTESTIHTVVRTNDAWFLRLESTRTSIPVEQFARQTNVDYVDHGRRNVTTETSDYGDILDRPRLAILDSRLVRFNEQWYVVGQLTNLDVDPADITVTGRLRSEDGSELAEYHAGFGTVHKVLPGETVPFRVAFEGVADAGTPETIDEQSGVFDPDSVVQLTLDEEVASYEVEARALVTGRNLERLALTDLQVVDDAAGAGEVVSGSIVNLGTETATIPFVTTTFLDEYGEVVWVDHQPLSTAIRSQRASEFEIDLFDLDQIENVDVPAREFDDGERTGIEAELVPTATIPLGDSAGAESISIIANTFERDQN